MKCWKKNFAFTLAEVLITLGIIGIVATMTITVLVPKIQDMQFKEAAKKAYSAAALVVLQMRQDYGTLASFSTTGNSFKSFFTDYFKVMQDCGQRTCVPYSGTSGVYKTLHGDPAQTYWMGNGQFVTNDGMFWGIWNNGSSSIYIVVDVNGYQAPPNVYGRDVFSFQVVNDVVLLPMGAKSTDYSASGLCSRVYSDVSQGLSCMEYVIQGIDY